jgi:hypothetical protein
VELLVRSIGIYAGLLFFPLALTGLVASPRNRWASRLAEALIVLIFSKFIIVTVLSLAASAIDSSAGYQGVLAGVGLLLLAAFAPWLLMRLLNVAEHAVTFSTAAQLRSSARQRVSSAGQFAVRTVATAGASGATVPGGSASAGFGGSRSATASRVQASATPSGAAPGGTAHAGAPASSRPSKSTAVGRSS